MSYISFSVLQPLIQASFDKTVLQTVTETSREPEGSFYFQKHPTKITIMAKNTLEESFREWNFDGISLGSVFRAFNTFFEAHRGLRR